MGEPESFAHASFSLVGEKAGRSSIIDAALSVGEISAVGERSPGPLRRVGGWWRGWPGRGARDTVKSGRFVVRNDGNLIRLPRAHHSISGGKLIRRRVTTSCRASVEPRDFDSIDTLTQLSDDQALQPFFYVISASLRFSGQSNRGCWWSAFDLPRSMSALGVLCFGCSSRLKIRS